jgi:hypothetical protein
MVKIGGRWNNRTTNGLHISLISYFRVVRGLWTHPEIRIRKVLIHHYFWPKRDVVFQPLLNDRFGWQSIYEGKGKLLGFLLVLYFLESFAMKLFSLNLPLLLLAAHGYAQSLQVNIYDNAETGDCITNYQTSIFPSPNDCYNYEWEGSSAYSLVSCPDNAQVCYCNFYTEYNCGGYETPYNNQGVCVWGDWSSMYCVILWSFNWYARCNLVVTFSSDFKILRRCLIVVNINISLISAIYELDRCRDFELTLHYFEKMVVVRTINL